MNRCSREPTGPLPAAINLRTSSVIFAARLLLTLNDEGLPCLQMLLIATAVNWAD